MQATLSRQEAALELLRRRRARESLIDFSQAIEIPGAPLPDDQYAWLINDHRDYPQPEYADPVPRASVTKHHALIMSKVQECLETDYGRLIIMAPPGSAKSTYVGVVAIPWAMGRWPGWNGIYVSHSNPPAERQSRRARQICRSALYTAIFEHKAGLARGQEGVREWKLTNDSAVLWGGLESGITSSRADAAVIDDPIRGAEHANSEGQRNVTWQAYELDLKTRLKPKASIILTMTRWNEQDTIGMLLPEDYHGQSGPVLCRDGMVWEVLNLPAECEHPDDPLGREIGQMLWPEWFEDRHWAIYRKNTRLWTSLFQQRPAADQGDEFQREWFKRYSRRPDRQVGDKRREVTWILSTDFAQTDVKKAAVGRPDWTRHGAWGISSDGELFYEHGIGFQKAPDKTIEFGIDIGRDYNCIAWLLEAGGIYNSWSGYIERRMKERSKKEKPARCFIPLVKMPSHQNKLLKAGAFRAMAEAGRVYVKEGPEGDAFIDECCAFPFGTWDDRVDMAGQVGRYVDEMWAQEKPKPEVRKQIKHLSAAAAEASRFEEEAELRRAARFRG